MRKTDYTAVQYFREMGAFLPSKAFGDSFALRFESESEGLQPLSNRRPPQKRACGPSLEGSVHSAVKNRHNEERHYGYIYRS